MTNVMLGCAHDEDDRVRDVRCGSFRLRQQRNETRNPFVGRLCASRVERACDVGVGAGSGSDRERVDGCTGGERIGGARRG